MADKAKALIAAGIGIGAALLLSLRSRTAKGKGLIPMPKVLDTPVGRHFRLSEFLRSEVLPAVKGYQPSAEEMLNLTALVTRVLDPLRDKFGPIIVNSGGRPESVAAAAGTTWEAALTRAGYMASRKSDHADFSAADIVPKSVPSDQWLAVVAYLTTNLDVRQIVASFKRDKQTGKLVGRYIHVAVVRPGKPRKEPGKFFIGVVDGKVVKEIKE